MGRTAIPGARGVAAAVLLSVAACSESAGQTADAAAAAGPMLPLEPGFYIRDGEACGNASNATLLLLRRNGVGGSRDFCAFERIEQEGPAFYTVTLRCAGDEAFAPPGQPADPFVEDHLYEILDERSYRVTGDGWTYEARFCPQDSLPEPWRSNTIPEE